MSKIARNDPCPCGSGEKYKKCCIDLAGEKLESPDDFIELVKAEFSKRELTSLDEMNQQLSVMKENFNSSPKSQFLGLSPVEMHNIVYEPFSLENAVFSFECRDNAKLKEVPLLKHSLYLLNKLKDAGEIKATQLGNLPRALVREMYEEFFSHDRYARLPNTEDDMIEIVRVRQLLCISGLMKKKSNKFTLTKKGENLLQESMWPELFRELTLCFMNQWNWAYGDSYSELPFIQSSAVFNLFLLHKKCQDWAYSGDVGQAYLHAFPNLVNEASGYFGPEEEIIRCFSTRFLNRVCLPLGLVEMREENGDGAYDYKQFYRVSRFFAEFFKFKHMQSKSH